MSDLEDKMEAARKQGFSEQNIQDAIATQRQTAISAGHRPEDVDEALGLGKPDGPVKPSQPWLDRIEQGFMQSSTLGKFLASTGRDLKEGFGAEPVGVSGESEKWMQQVGLLPDPAVSRGLQPLRTFNEALIRPLAAAADVVMRGINAGTFAAVGLVPNALADLKQSISPNEQDQNSADSLKRDLFAMTQVAGAAAGEHGMLSRHQFTPDGKLYEHPVGDTPRESDFPAAAKALTGGESSEHTEANLKRAFEEQGAHPAEVAHDAQEDPTIAQDALSTTDRRIEAYGGDNEPKEEPGTGISRVLGGMELEPAGGGKPPTEPPPESLKRAPGEPPEGEKLSDNEYRRAQQTIMKQLSVGDEPEAERATWGMWYRRMADKYFTIGDTVKMSGLDLITADDPYRLSRLFSGWGKKADAFLNHAQFDFNTYEKIGPSLKDILKPVRGDLDGLRVYLASARALELEERGVTHGFDVQEAQKVVEGGTEKYGDVAVKLYQFQNNLAKYLRDSGVLSRNGYNAMLAANKHYIPFHVAFLNRISEEGGSGTLQAAQPVHKLFGSEAMRIDPLESVVKNTYLYMQMAEKNAVVGKLADVLMAAEPTDLKRAPGREIALSPTEERTVAPYERMTSRTAMEDLTRVGEVWQALEDATRPTRESEIRVFRDGKPTTYIVDPELARAVKGLDVDTMSWFTRLLLKPVASVLRAGAVLTPDFWSRHIIRDTTYAASTYSEGGIFNPFDTVRGLMGLITKHEDFVGWLQGGGGNIGVASLDRRYMQENLQALTKETGLMERAWNVVTHPLHPLQVTTELVTSATHLGAYMKAMDKIRKAREAGKSLDEVKAPGIESGMPTAAPALPGPLKGDLRIQPGTSIIDAMEQLRRVYSGEETLEGAFTDVPTDATQNKKDIQHAAWVSRDTAVDAARIGAWTKGWNAASVFANIKIQDADRIVRAFIKAPMKTALLVGGSITLPAIATWLHGHGDPRYDDAAAWEKAMFYIIPTDSWETTDWETFQDRANSAPHMVRLANGVPQVNNGITFRIPKAFTAGIVFGTGAEMLLDHFLAEKPEAFHGLARALQENTVGEVAPALFAPMLEQGMNKNFMSGATLIPDALEKQLPEYQYTNYTSDIAKRLGRIIGTFPGMTEAAVDKSHPLQGGAHALTSPILLQNYYRQWTGTLGQYMLELAENGLRASGVTPEIRPAWEMSDMPFIRAFIMRYPKATTQNVEDFYQRYDRAQTYLKTWQNRAREGDEGAMKKIQAAGGDEIFGLMEGTKKALGVLSQATRDTYQNPDIPAREKRQLIDGTYFHMMKVAKEGMDVIRAIEQENGK